MSKIVRPDRLVVKTKQVTRPVNRADDGKVVKLARAKKARRAKED